VAEDHLLSQDVLNRQTPTHVLLEPVGGGDLPDLSHAPAQVMQRLNQLLHLELSYFISFIRQDPDRTEVMIIIQDYLGHLTRRVASTIHPVDLLLEFPDDDPYPL
jgi:hypothetical protein